MMKWEVWVYNLCDIPYLDSSFPDDQDGKQKAMDKRQELINAGNDRVEVKKVEVEK